MKIKNKAFETMASKNTSELLKKEFTAKTSFHLARLFDRFQSESKIYFSEKQKLANKYAKKDDGGNAIIKDGNYTILNVNKFSEELNELLEIEIDIGLETIEIDFDKEPKLAIEEMMILLPFISEVKNG